MILDTIYFATARDLGYLAGQVAFYVIAVVVLALGALWLARRRKRY